MSALENDDAAIVGAVRADDHQRFAMLVQRYNQALFRVVRDIVRAEADAEDVLQEAHLARTRRRWLSEENVRVRLHRARAALRADLQEAPWPSVHQFDGARCERMINAVMGWLPVLAKPAAAF